MKLPIESRRLKLLAVYRGMRVILTKNLNKETVFVNGMSAEVLAMGRRGVLVLTKQARRIMVHPWTSPERATHFPMQLGYARTLHKVQGAMLPHITARLDVKNMPAAAYVAPSRVEYDS